MEPNELPTLDQLTQTLRANLDPAPNGNGGEHQPSAGAGDQPLAIRLEHDGATATPAAPASAADYESLRQDLEATKARLQQEEGRRRDSQGSFHQANQQAQIAQAVLEGVSAARQREAALFEQAKAAQPPSVANPDDLLANGQALLDFFGKYGQYIEGRLLGMFAPYVQQLAEVQGYTGANLKLAQRSAWNEAKQLAQESLGVSAKDFDAVRPEIEQLFSSHGPAGAQLLLDPEQVKNAFVLLQVNKGLNPLAKPRTSPIPPSADPRPAALPAAHSARLAQLNPIARQVALTLGFEDGVLPMEASALARMVVGAQ